MINIFAKKTQIELAIWSINRDYKVETKTIVNTIYKIYEKDRIIFPNTCEDDTEFYGWDTLSFRCYSFDNVGTVLSIERSIVPNPDSWEHTVIVELIFENIPFENICYVAEPVDIDYDFLTDINNSYTYCKVKSLIPNQFKVRTKELP